MDIFLKLIIILALSCVVLFLIYAIIKLIKKDSVTKTSEIISMVNEGHEQGVLETAEATMINNIFDFVDKEAGEIMTNRKDIVSVDKNEKLSDAISFMLSNSNSRYPVFDENLDHIIGILFLKDAMRFLSKDETLGEKPIVEIKGLIRKAMFITETMNINDLFKSMQSKKTQLAIVVDEYGQTVGLIAMEDILEEIVGNIMDEYDVEEKHIRKRGDGEYIVDGFTPLSELEDSLNVSFNTEEFETLNGFMISKLDRLPEKDEVFSVNVDDYEFSVLSVENRMITKVAVKKIVNKETEKEEEIK